MLAINIALWNAFPQRFILIFINIGVLIICLLISKIEYKFVNSHKKWIDWLYFACSKNLKPYIVYQQSLNYTILSETEATFEDNSLIKVTKNVDDFHYWSKYQWEQEDEIKFTLIDQDKYNYSRTDERTWTQISINPKQHVRRKTELPIAYTLHNLHINNLAKRSFVSYKIPNKIKHLNITAKINKDLKPINGEFIIYNIFNIEIARESIPFDENDHKFEKSIYCPRKGRQYVLQWAYKKE